MRLLIPFLLALALEACGATEASSLCRKNPCAEIHGSSGNEAITIYANDQVIWSGVLPGSKPEIVDVPSCKAKPCKIRVSGGGHSGEADLIWETDKRRPVIVIEDKRIRTFNVPNIRDRGQPRRAP